MECKLIAVEMIDSQGITLDLSLVKLYEALFEEEGLSGLVLVHPRKGPFGRYRIAGNGEVYEAAKRVFASSVRCLVAEFPEELGAITPDISAVARNISQDDKAHPLDSLDPIARAERLLSLMKEKKVSQKDYMPMQY